MAAVRVFRMMSLCSAKTSCAFDIKPCVAYASKNIDASRESRYWRNPGENSSRMMSLLSGIYVFSSKGTCFNSCFSNRLLENSGFSSSLSFLGVSPWLGNRRFSSGSEGKGSDTTANSGGSETSVMDAVDNGGEWIGKMKELWLSTVEAAKYGGYKAKGVSDEAAPHVQKFLDTYPYLRDVIVPVGGTLLGTLLAWSVLPSVLRRFHRYSVQSPVALLARSSLLGPSPYEKSFWSALEDPIRYFITFMAMLKIGEMAGPSVIASQYLFTAWRGAFVISLVWFLQRWKTNVITRTLEGRSIEGLERDNLLTVDKISSVGLFIVGITAIAEACGVAVQSILTVGGIGGVATAFAARDVLGNVLSGLSVQLSRPFSIGDTIKAGSVEGQVVEIGLTTTSLLTAEKFPVIVPNSLFSSQVIVNKSRAKWRSMATKVPLQIDDIHKISEISEDIKKMLQSNSNVFLEKEDPFCVLSRIEKSYAELTFGCNLKNMGREAEEEILLQAVEIIMKHGVALGRTWAEATH